MQIRTRAPVKIIDCLTFWQKKTETKLMKERRTTTNANATKRSFSPTPSARARAFCLMQLFKLWKFVDFFFRHRRIGQSVVEMDTTRLSSHSLTLSHSFMSETETVIATFFLLLLLLLLLHHHLSSKWFEARSAALFTQKTTEND